MDSKERIKKFIKDNFPSWEKIDFSKYENDVDFKKDFSELYKIENDEIILVSYTNISITGSDRPKPQLRVFLDEYKKPFYFAKKHQLRYYLFSIFTKDDEMAKGLDNFNPKEYVISIETNLDSEGARRDLRSIYDYANNHLNGSKFLKCTRANYKADINQASFIYIGSEEKPDKVYFEYFINIFDSRPYMNSSNNNIIEVAKTNINQPLQQIYYGAPGTGKSHKTDEVASKYPETVRTTFHPDSDYSTFVGAYKPTMNKERKCVVIDKEEKPVKPMEGGSEYEEKIAYKFVKQAFLKAYVKAWKLFKETYEEGVDLAPQFLVIEEINRGNCAQIFGDLFQLLDRKQNFSEYPIEADDDIRKALLEEDTKENPSFGENGLQLTPGQITYVNQVFDKDGEPSRGVAEKICNGQVLVLPPNLYIWATMNTSDQSLFPIDSAFKRRWEWKYVRINEGKDKETGQPLNFRIQFTTLEGEKVDESWWEFIQKINEKIEGATKSEDKKLGYFFCKPDKKANDTDKENTIISAETFVGKVVFYLWQDVFKDYGFKSDIFKKEGNARLAFHDFYPHNIEPDEEKNPEGIDLKLVKRFIDKVMDRKPSVASTDTPAAAPTTE